MLLDTVGKRIADIRARLGERPGRPLTTRAFVALLRERTGVVLDHSELSRMERDARRPKLEHIAAIAQLDPEARGREWLAWGDVSRGT